jgi:F-type H+-transporting ATPase subunit epsilon
MAELIQLEVTTPERELVREPVESVQAPGKDGYLGILPGHAPLLGQLGAGVLTYTAAGGRVRYLSVAGGFLEVLPDHIRILADVAEKAEEIDVERAKAALARAQEGLSNASLEDMAKMSAAMDRANARIATAGQAR